MENITVKFGGSSLADAAQFRKVATIIHADPLRRFVVVSAPGRRNSNDIKVTDLLYKAHDAAGTKDFPIVMAQIRNRYAEISEELNLHADLGFDEIETAIQNGAGKDFCASRGEYLNARLMALYLNRPFIDAADHIFFHTDGSFDADRTQASLQEALHNLSGAVLPGFYGSMPDGTVHTFSRGGSDITGAIVARAAGSLCYENWTDVSGILATDPRIVPEAVPIREITYRELRELTYTGASVLHEDAIYPVRIAGIPIHIRNTNVPEDPGTIITKEATCNHPPVVTGIAGKKEFTIIHIEKDQMNETPGFAYKVLEAFAKRGISVEHLPTGIDSISVVVPSCQVNDCRMELLNDLRESVNPDIIFVENGLAMVAIVGQGMVRRQGIAAKAFRALALSGINIRMIDQGSSELNIIVGIDGIDYEKAVRALYDEFFTGTSQ